MKLIIIATFFILSYLVNPTVPTPFTGTYESTSKENSIFNPYVSYALGDGVISFNQVVDLNRTTWQGLYTVQDSLIEVLVFRTLRQSLNAGFTSRYVRQHERVLTIGMNDGRYLFEDTLKSRPVQIGGPESVLKLFVPEPVQFEVTADTAKHNRFPVINCLGYCGVGSNGFFASQRSWKSTQDAENRILGKLAKELNKAFAPVSSERSTNCRNPHLSALIPTKNSIPFKKRKVMIIDNSTSLNTERVKAVLHEFYLKQSLTDARLQEYLLVELTVVDGEICLVSP
ncbi:hypothetical protein FUA23_07975 [Neolewinella aurantiaca]|uniref:Uncharacterized protein n=1 Tax=Neolewinella aurantiaca TaxID=2602767 RepID=A0A5C7FX92_9BACT|nr:hypothetical protein [Neolewinella aurantiaca]TXF90164.1 hypothetical protein FUA23_07975 [Neolewinella aurantiaca]